MLYKKYFTRKFCNFMLLQTLMTFRQHKERIAIRLEGFQVSERMQKHYKSSLYKLCLDFFWNYNLCVTNKQIPASRIIELVSWAQESNSDHQTCLVKLEEMINSQIATFFMNFYEGVNHFFRRPNTYDTFMLLSCHFGALVSIIIVKRGQYVAQKFTFCVPQLTERHTVLEKHTKVMSKWWQH